MNKPPLTESKVQAFVFDLDGTLVKTEQLKAQSYARAAANLCPHKVSEAEVIEAFKDVVGLSRREVATTLMQRFELEEKAAALTEKLGVNKPWQAYVQVRLRHYHALLDDPEVLTANRWEHATALLAQARNSSCQTALATMSHREQVQKVLAVLDLDKFDFVATRDDVENSKPDPEIYQLVADELDIKPQHMLVLEDSPAGVEAALNAGAQVIAVSTPFTQKRLHASGLLPEARIVDDHKNLNEVVKTVLADA